MPPSVCALDRRSRRRVRHASSSSSSGVGASICELHPRHRLANCLLESTGQRLGIGFAWLITDEGEPTFGPRPFGVGDHDTAGKIDRRSMKFLCNEGVKISGDGTGRTRTKR